MTHGSLEKWTLDTGCWLICYYFLFVTPSAHPFDSLKIQYCTCISTSLIITASINYSSFSSYYKFWRADDCNVVVLIALRINNKRNQSGQTDGSAQSAYCLPPTLPLSRTIYRRAFSVPSLEEEIVRRRHSPRQKKIRSEYDDE